MRRLVPFVLLVIACGDNHDLPDAHVAIDAPPPDAHIVMPRAVGVAGDFGSPGVGTVSKLEITDLMMRQNIAAGAALGDPMVRQFGNRLYVVNRFGSNNVTILDAKNLTLVDQLSTGTDSNPQDVAVVGTKLYVPALGTAGVVVLEPGKSPKTIDLATPLGDTDGKPDCVSAYAVGTKVYVACDMQTNFVNVLDSKIAVIDTANDTYVASVTTPYKNPIGLFAQAPQSAAYFGDLLIPLVPDYSALTSGCIARVSTTGTTPTVACGPTNAELGGFANRIAIDDTTNTAYIAVAESFTSGKLRKLDLSNGTLAAAALSTSSQLIIDVAVCPGGDVVATDQTTNAAGLRVWRGQTERTTEALSIGMPPTVNALVCYDP